MGIITDHASDTGNVGIQRIKGEDIMEYVNDHADDVLRLCVYYLGGIEDAKEAFLQVFSEAAKEGNPSRTRLFSIVRHVCVADYFPDDYEAELFKYYFGLSDSEIGEILGRQVLVGA